MVEVRTDSQDQSDRCTLFARGRSGDCWVRTLKERIKSVMEAIYEDCRSFAWC